MKYHEFYEQFRDSFIPVSFYEDPKKKGNKKTDFPRGKWGKHGRYDDSDFEGKNGIALKTGLDTVQVIDVDTKDFSLIQDEKLREWLEDRDLNGDCTTVETKRGYHFYINTDKPIANGNKIDRVGAPKDYKGYVETRGEPNGLIYIYADSPFASYELTVITDEPTPLEGIEHLLRAPTEQGVEVNHDVEDDVEKSLMLAEREQAISDDEVKQLFKDCPSHFEDGNKWLALTMGLYDRFLGNAKGKEIYMAFCKRTREEHPEQEYSNSLAADIAKWSRGHLKGRTTFKHLVNYRAELIADGFMSRIEEAENSDDIEQIIAEVASESYLPSREGTDKDTRLKLAEGANKRLKTLKKDGKAETVYQTRTLVSQMAFQETAPEENEEGPDYGGIWLNDIVLLNNGAGGARYYLFSENRVVSTDYLDNKYYGELLTLAKTRGKKSSTFKTVTRGSIISCIGQDYLPYTTERLIKTKHGAHILNMYTGGPECAEEYSERGRFLVDYYIRHLQYIFGDDYYETFIKFVAYSLQSLDENNNGKLPWAVVLQSGEGIGKSVVGNALIHHVYGANNAQTVDPTVLLQEQTAWATNGRLRILEEIKVVGHIKSEVMNRLKPLITNTHISRIEKYEATQTVSNYMNFIAFTNETDAIPVTKGDRRWWIVHSPIHSIADLLHKSESTSAHDYYAPLWELARKDSPYGPELLKYFMDYDLNGFDADFQPVSHHKERAIMTESTAIDGQEQMEDIIMSGYKGITPDVISSKQLQEATLGYDATVSAQSAHRKLLKKLGYVKIKTRPKIDGEFHYLWTTRSDWHDTQVVEEFKHSMLVGEAIEGFEDLTKEDIFEEER